MQAEAKLRAFAELDLMEPVESGAPGLEAGARGLAEQRIARLREEDAMPPALAQAALEPSREVILTRLALAAVELGVAAGGAQGNSRFCAPRAKPSRAPR